MISIIIPAHNEAGVIGRCLDGLLNGAAPGELQVVVVCNGCTDRTAEIAQAHGPMVQVIQTEVASKSRALNLGDRAAGGFPRFYVDADVAISLDAVREVSQVLGRGRALVAAPRIHFDLRGRSWPVRAFYDIWSRLPYCQQGMVGSGAYALSEQGRRRFEEFPSITADDAYVRLLFEPRERQTVQSCHFTVTPPTSLGGIVRIKTRGHFGNYELRRRYPRMFHNDGCNHRRALLRLGLRPWLWPRLAVYLYVRVASRILSYRRYYFGDHRQWERDDTSRQGGPLTPAHGLRQ